MGRAKHHACCQEEAQEGARWHALRQWPYRQAPQACLRSWQRWWPAHAQNCFRQVSPGLFRYVGMRYFHYKKNPHHMTTVNVDKLWSMVGLEQRKQYAKKTDGTAPLIDLTEFGIFKCLGKGKLPPQPIAVKAKFFSKEAEKKIKDAGGACILCA